MKIYIAGSVSQYDEVLRIAKAIGNDAGVIYTTPEEQQAETAIQSAFQKISECNVVMALRYPDGTFEDGVSYEIEFAKWLKKPIAFITSDAPVTVKTVEASPSTIVKNIDKNADKNDGTKIFTYYQNDDCRSEKTIGIVMAKDRKEAEKKGKRILQKILSRRIYRRRMGD